MKPPILLIEVIENAQKYDSEIRIARDGGPILCLCARSGFHKKHLEVGSCTSNAIRESGFTGTIVVEKS